jgi:hypothetical protein
LCEVFPDGASARISYGILNLTHRESHASPTPLQPGRVYRVALQLNDLGHRFGTGNRVRLALSTAYWPIVWPSPETVSLEIHCRASSLSLPQRKPNPLDSLLPEFPPPEAAPPLAQTQITPPHNSWTVEQDVMAGSTRLRRVNDDGVHRIDSTGLECNVRSEFRFTISPDRPESARFDSEVLRTYRRPDWLAECETTITATCSPTTFDVEATLRAREGTNTIRTRHWSFRVSRDLV